MAWVSVSSVEWDGSKMFTQINSRRTNTVGVESSTKHHRILSTQYNVSTITRMGVESSVEWE